jgi:hypothetical protein
MRASENSCGRPPTPPAAGIHHIHTAGGANGSTMVMLLSCCCAFCVVVCAFCAVSSSCHLSSYVDKYERITLGRVIDEAKCPTQACTIPITLPKRLFRSNPRLANNHKYCLEHFGQLNHAHSTKIDLTLTSAGKILWTVIKIKRRGNCG